MMRLFLMLCEEKNIYDFGRDFFIKNVFYGYRREDVSSGLKINPGFGTI